jgi:hypothetical protein
VIPLASFSSFFFDDSIAFRCRRTPSTQGNPRARLGLMGVARGAVHEASNFPSLTIHEIFFFRYWVA